MFSVFLKLFFENTKTTEKKAKLKYSDRRNSMLQFNKWYLRAELKVSNNDNGKQH